MGFSTKKDVKLNGRNDKVIIQNGYRITSLRYPAGVKRTYLDYKAQ